MKRYETFISASDVLLSLLEGFFILSTRHLKCLNTFHFDSLHPIGPYVLQKDKRLTVWIIAPFFFFFLTFFSLSDLSICHFLGILTKAHSLSCVLKQWAAAFHQSEWQERILVWQVRSITCFSNYFAQQCIVWSTILHNKLKKYIHFWLFCNNTCVLVSLK